MLLNLDYSLDISTDEFTVNTWTDFHIAPKERLSVATPPVKTNYVEIPGMNGSLDYTEVLAGEPLYGNRTGSWEFIVVNGFAAWYSIYDQMRTLLHGKKVNVILREQPNYIYTGRLELDQWKSEEHNSSITINYNFNPFKTFKEGTVEDWLWNDLTFKTDVYRIYYGSFIVNGTRERSFYNPLDKEVNVSLTLSAPMVISMYGSVWDVPAGSFDDFTSFTRGDNKHTIQLGPVTSDMHGENPITFSCDGSGSVIVNYERGATNI